MTYTLIPGQSHSASEEETMSMIRSVLTDDTAEPSAIPVPAPVGFVEPTRDPAPRRRADDLPPIEAAAPVAKTPKTRRIMKVPGIAASLRRSAARVRTFRPSTRALAMVSLLLLVVVRPHWVVIAVVLMLAMLIGSFLVLGADRIWRGVLTWLARVDARDPVRAQALRARLDRFACRWDAVLDVFPDGMVDGLYMPDLQAMQDAEEAHTEAMSQRLDRMAQEG